ncbi:MAG: hypothetical protein R6W79_08930 [Acidimicrobiia bacterium]
MFAFAGSPVPVRSDVIYAYRSIWGHFARPGPILTGPQRIELLAGVRSRTANRVTATWGTTSDLGTLADTLYHDPAQIDGAMVRAAADIDGDPVTVEVIALVSILSSVDETHHGLGIEPEPLPEPLSGHPTGRITEGLLRRRLHVPAPPGPIPVTLDLLLDEGAAFTSLFGPQYMTDREMALETFRRDPGLDRAQIEVVSSRTSLHNECFY